MTRTDGKAERRFLSSRFPYADHVIDGETLRLARQRAGLSQSELGAMVGVTGRTVRAWEADIVKPYAEKRIADLDVLWRGESPVTTMDELSTAALLAELSALVGELGGRLARYERDQTETSSGSEPTEAPSTVTPATDQPPRQHGVTVGRSGGPRRPKQ